MKFIKLRNGMRKGNSYTVNIDNIACIETVVSENGMVKTWIQGTTRKQSDEKGVTKITKGTKGNVKGNTWTKQN